MTDDLISRADAKAACQKVADEAKGYGIPQMTMGAHTCRDAILALPAADLSSPLGAVAMRDAAISAIDADGEYVRAIGLSSRIRAIPLPDHAALLAAALKLPEVAAMVGRGQKMRGHLHRTADDGDLNATAAMIEWDDALAALGPSHE